MVAGCCDGVEEEEEGSDSCSCPTSPLPAPSRRRSDIDHARRRALRRALSGTRVSGHPGDGRRPARVSVIGGGPVGLWVAVLIARSHCVATCGGLKLRMRGTAPAVRVHEKRGWVTGYGSRGVVLQIAQRTDSLLRSHITGSEHCGPFSPVCTIAALETALRHQVVSYYQPQGAITLDLDSPVDDPMELIEAEGADVVVVASGRNGLSQDWRRGDGRQMEMRFSRREPALIFSFHQDGPPREQRVFDRIGLAHGAWAVVVRDGHGGKCWAYVFGLPAALCGVLANRAATAAVAQSFTAAAETLLPEYALHSEQKRKAAAAAAAATQKAAAAQPAADTPPPPPSPPSPSQSSEPAEQFEWGKRPSGAVSPQRLWRRWMSRNVGAAAAPAADGSSRSSDAAAPAALCALAASAGASIVAGRRTASDSPKGAPPQPARISSAAALPLLGWQLRRSCELLDKIVCATPPVHACRVTDAAYWHSNQIVHRVDRPGRPPAFIVLCGDAACGRPFYIGSTLNHHLADAAFMVSSVGPAWSHWGAGKAQTEEQFSPFGAVSESYGRRQSTLGFAASKAPDRQGASALVEAGPVAL